VHAAITSQAPALPFLNATALLRIVLIRAGG